MNRHRGFLPAILGVALVSGCAQSAIMGTKDFEITDASRAMLARDLIAPLRRAVPRSEKLELVSITPGFTTLLETELRRAGYAVTVVERAQRSPSLTVRYDFGIMDAETVRGLIRVETGFQAGRVYTVSGTALRPAGPRTVRLTEHWP